MLYWQLQSLGQRFVVIGNVIEETLAVWEQPSTQFVVSLDLAPLMDNGCLKRQENPPLRIPSQSSEPRSNDSSDWFELPGSDEVHSVSVSG
jgi:hypothetical protein